MQYLQKMFFIEWNQKLLIKILHTTEKSLDSRIKKPLENMVNWEGKDKDLLALIKYIAEEDKLGKVLENPQVIKTPVVRNGKQSTLGYLEGVEIRVPVAF